MYDLLLKTSQFIFKYYQSIVIDRPKLTLIALSMLFVFFTFHIPQFKLDVSPDSLILEDDEDLRYFREISENYGSGSFLIITYSPYEDLFSEKSLNDLRALRNDLTELDFVRDVFCILNVPLVNSPRLDLTDLTDDIPTLDTTAIPELARIELRESPFYKNLIMNDDGSTTGLQILLKSDNKLEKLLKHRNQLRIRNWKGELSTEEGLELKEAELEYKNYHHLAAKKSKESVRRVREIMDQHRASAKMFLGGPPMIVSDVLDYIRNDLNIFGFGIVTFLTFALAVLFRRARWILIPMACCTATALIMIGYLGFVDWRITVISSNFISILLVVTMSMSIHLTVRYRELHYEMPGASQRELVILTVRHMARPCLYTSLTTIVAFASLVMSNIRPVIDFGWIMTAGISLALIITFIVFPAALMLLKPGEAKEDYDFTQSFTLSFASFSENHKLVVVGLTLIVSALSIIGISKMTVENRFIDYFQEDTEIYQGMLEIDQQLGGTTPLDIIINAPESYYKEIAENEAAKLADDFEDDFADEEDEANPLDGSFWYNPTQLSKLETVHDYLQDQPEIGKVLSLSTTMKIAKQLNDDSPLGYVDLILLTSFIPEEVRKILIDPFLGDNGNQVRITTRIIDSDPDLVRADLIKKIETDLEDKFGFSPDQFRLTSMVILYNNMLQSLFTSQILTIGTVFLGILLMFSVLFRSFYIAILSIAPNILSAAVVLGAMGWLGIPLDLMTITIAAITIGIAVDDTIHYIVRFKMEFPNDRDYVATMKRCHNSIGKAMYYTSVTIIVGFSILCLSNFNPSIYFGVLTGMAMLIALVANLTLLPILLIVFKPLGKGEDADLEKATA